MGCTFVDLGNGAQAIVCGPRRLSRCVYCGRPATKLCDGPAPNVRRPGQETCDKALCDRCATSIGRDRDLCREHAREMEKVHMKPWLQGRDVLVLDTETTGLAPMRDRVVQLGACVFRDGELVKKWSSLVNPGVPVPPEVSKIHGLTDEKLKDAPSFVEAWGALSVEVMPEKAPLLVAHNADFDQPFLLAETMRCMQPAAWLVTERWFCTLALTKAIKGVGKYEKGYKLVDLCAKAGIAFDGTAHDAANDAEAAGRLLYFVQRWLPDDIDAVYAKQTAWQHANR